MKTATSQAVSNAAEAPASLFDDQIAPGPALASATDGVIRPLPNRPSRQAACLPAAGFRRPQPTDRSTTRARQGTHPRVPARNASARLRRPLAVLAALVVGLLVSAATLPAAFATIPDPGGAVGYAGVGPASAPAVRVVVTGGMAGWQITSIAIGSALFAATAAVLLYRALAVRKAASATTA